jgi:hypothetical protein
MDAAANLRHEMRKSSFVGGVDPFSDQRRSAMQLQKGQTCGGCGMNAEDVPGKHYCLSACTACHTMFYCGHACQVIHDSLFMLWYIVPQFFCCEHALTILVTFSRGFTEGRLEKAQAGMPPQEEEKEEELCGTPRYQSSLDDG